MIDLGALDGPGRGVPVGEGPAEGRGSGPPRVLVEGLAAVGEQAALGGPRGSGREQRPAELDRVARRAVAVARQGGAAASSHQVATT